MTLTLSATNNFDENARGSNKPSKIEIEAHAMAESYMYGTIDNYNWHILIKLVKAEASTKEQERAWVAAVVLNRVKWMFKNKKKGPSAKTIDDVARQNGEFETVTGNLTNNHQPSDNFKEVPNSTLVDQICRAIKDYIDDVPEKTLYFTAANIDVYSKKHGGSGNPLFLGKLIANNGKKIGKTIFGNREDKNWLSGTAVNLDYLENPTEELKSILGSVINEHGKPSQELFTTLGLDNYYNGGIKGTPPVAGEKLLKFRYNQFWEVYIGLKTYIKNNNININIAGIQLYLKNN